MSHVLAEYRDMAGVFQDKVARLAALMAISKRTVVYSGAGISTSAGVGQAARGEERNRTDNSTNATPTPTHLALAELSRRGLVHSWIQQNHDGLPQKAGYPQVRQVESNNDNHFVLIT